ncbi:hypothetical protein ACR6HW_04215 [Fusibacter sp. JL298sf-3]
MMNNTMSRVLISCACIIMFLVGCNAIERKDVEEEDYEIGYNPFVYELQKIYKSKVNTEDLIEGEQRFQYPIMGLENAYIDGDSIENDFGVIQLSEEGYDILYKIGKYEGMFPIGFKDGKLYFTHTYYSSENAEFTEKRRIAVLDLKTEVIEEYVYTEGLTVGGALSNGVIYFAQYIPDQDKFVAKKIEIDDFKNRPEILQEGLESDLILAEGDQYFVEVNNKIEINGKAYDVGAENYLVKNYLMQISLTEGGDLKCSIYNIENGELELEVDQMLGLQWLDSGLKFFSREGERKFVY